MKKSYTGTAMVLAWLLMGSSALTAPASPVAPPTPVVIFKGLPDSRAGLVTDGKALYGTTWGGGSPCCNGTVFKLTHNGDDTWSQTVIYSFKNSPDGANPESGLVVEKQGELYGTTYFGGYNNGPSGSGGIAFKLTPPEKGKTTWTETVIYKFCSQPSCIDGASPAAELIIASDGALHGTTFWPGVVFKLTPPTNGQTVWTETVLASGLNFNAGLSIYKGELYGNATDSVFKLTPPTNGHTAWTLTTLYSTFGYLTGGLTIDRKGIIYGTTTFGGAGCQENTFGCGMVFKLTPQSKGQTSWVETTLYSFKGKPNDGFFSTARLLYDNGILYGTTYYGGATDEGTLFKLTPPTNSQSTWTETIHSFSGSDGFNPYGGLTLYKGTLYGTTYSTVFKLK